MSSTVDVLYSQNGFWYLVVSPSNDNITYIVTIDTATGNPLFTGIPYIDLQVDHSIAVQNLIDAGAEVKVHGYGLIGMISAEKSITIGVIDQAEISGTLPNGHIVKVIKHAEYIFIPLRGCQLKSSPVEEFQINNFHYFCDTYDLTHLFPSNERKIYNRLKIAENTVKPRTIKDLPDKGFIWNNGWKKPFEILGIGHICIDLLQGACLTRDFPEYNFKLTYVARRSSLNPGTRFAARGLNNINAPGNEVECELLFQRGKQFWTQHWRRGSIPIRWKTTMATTLSSIKNKVEEDFFKGTADYFTKLSHRYEIIPTEIDKGVLTNLKIAGMSAPALLLSPLDPIDQAPAPVIVPIRCISLLKIKGENAETPIKESYQKSLTKLHELGITNVSLHEFDLARKLKNDGSHESMKQMLFEINPLCMNDGFTAGTFTNEPDEPEEFVITEHQKGLMRFNCADSLDRTNLATFYYAMKVTAQWCLLQKTGLSEACKKGSQEACDLTKPYLVVDKVITDFLAVSFVEVGNIISRVYTNTNAIKLNCIRTFAPSLIGTSNDATISVKRRVNNSINDPARQKVIELFTSIPKLTWYHRIDYDHIFTVPNSVDPDAPKDEKGNVIQFPRAVLSSEIKKYVISTKKLIVCFPCPMIPYQILILLFPSNQKLQGIYVEGGMTLDTMKFVSELVLPDVERPLWCRFDVKNPEKHGFVPSKCGYVRFLSLEFDIDSDKFTIGPIKFEARSCFSSEKTTIYSPDFIKCSTRENSDDLISFIDDDDPSPPPAPQDPPDNDIFVENFEAFLGSHATLNDIVLLEKFRLQHRVTEIFRFNLALEKGINPWYVDASSQLIASPTYLCAFCKKPIVNSEASYYMPSHVYPGLMVKSPDGPQTKKSFPICKDCKGQADSLVQVAETFESQYKAPQYYRAHFSVDERYPASSGKIESFTNESTAAFLHDDSCYSLLWPKGGSVKMKKGETKALDFFIVQQAVVKSIRIKASSSNLRIFDIDSGAELKKSISGNHIDFSYEVQPISQRLRISIVADEDLELNRVRAFYVSTIFFEENISVAIPETFTQTSISNIITTFDSNRRTENVKLNDAYRILAVQVEMVIEPGVHTPLSLCFALYNKDQLSYSRLVLLPEVSAGSMLWYKFDEDGVDADCIKVFYLDRSSTMKPHIFRFSIKF